MKKTEKIILLKDNNKLGKKFEIIELKRGFILNYLLPRQEVMLYNHNNFSWVEKQKAQEEQKKLRLEEKVREIYKKINNFTLVFTLKKDEKGEPFGSIGFKEILQELEKSGFSLEKSQLLEFHSLNKLGESILRVKLSNDIIANLKIIIT